MTTHLTTLLDSDAGTLRPEALEAIPARLPNIGPRTPSTKAWQRGAWGRREADVAERQAVSGGTQQALAGMAGPMAGAGRSRWAGGGSAWPPECSPPGGQGTRPPGRTLAAEQACRVPDPWPGSAWSPYQFMSRRTARRRRT